MMDDSISVLENRVEWLRGLAGRAEYTDHQWGDRLIEAEFILKHLKAIRSNTVLDVNAKDSKMKMKMMDEAFKVTMNRVQLLQENYEDSPARYPHRLSEARGFMRTLRAFRKSMVISREAAEDLDCLGPGISLLDRSDVFWVKGDEKWFGSNGYVVKSATEIFNVCGIKRVLYDPAKDREDKVEWS